MFYQVLSIILQCLTTFNNKIRTDFTSQASEKWSMALSTFPLWVATWASRERLKLRKCWINDRTVFNHISEVSHLPQENMHLPWARKGKQTHCNILQNAKLSLWDSLAIGVMLPEHICIAIFSVASQWILFSLTVHKLSFVILEPYSCLKMSHAIINIFLKKMLDCSRKTNQFL